MRVAQHEINQSRVLCQGEWCAYIIWLKKKLWLLISVSLGGNQTSTSKIVIRISVRYAAKPNYDTLTREQKCYLSVRSDVKRPVMIYTIDPT